MLQDETVTVKHTVSSILREEWHYKLQDEAEMKKYVVRCIASHLNIHLLLILLSSLSVVRFWPYG